MNLSGILVVVPPAEVGATIARLEALPGVEVYHSDPPTGRLIVVQEAPTIRAEVEGLGRIKALPNVTLAEMVEHHFPDDQEILDHLPPDLKDGLPPIPSFLQDD